MPVIAVIAIDRRAERAYFSSFGSSGFKTSVLHANNRTIFPQEVENSKPCSSISPRLRAGEGFLLPRSFHAWVGKGLSTKARGLG